MLRRALAVAVLLVLGAGTALAGDSVPLPIQILNASELSLERTADPLELIDEVGDIYHPAGTPGFGALSVDIGRVELSGWVFRANVDAPIPENPFFEASQVFADILSGGSDAPMEELAPIFIATTYLEGDVGLEDDVYCEYPLAWLNPMYPVFQGIEGDLFNGTNRVTVVRAGGAVPGGFEVASLAYQEGGWFPATTIGWGALVKNQVTVAIPAGAFGPAGDQLRQIDYARGGGATDTEPVDINVGAFCSEGGQSFDPARGGVDILQESLDLGSLPISVIEVAGTTTPTTAAPATTAAPTTTGAPATTVASGTSAPNVDGGGGGMSPALIALLVGGAGAAAWAAVRAATKGRDEDRPSARSFRVSFDSGPSASFAEVSGLSLEAGSMDYRDGSEPAHVRKMGGVSKHTDITLKRGTAGDIAFWNWVVGSMNTGASTGGGSIGLVSESEPSLTWTFSDSWPTKVDGPGLKATGAETALETLDLRVENLRISGSP